jgi:SAM-dependent methyltransferase
MRTNNRLITHYDSKYYADFEEKSVTPISIVSKPRNRFEAGVWAALQNAGGRYLEIGAGSGSTLLTLLKYFDELVATELSPVRSQAMKRRFANNKDAVRIICNNIEIDRLEYPESYFDTAVMLSVIEHLIEPIGALMEIKRVLKPNGRLIISTENIAKWTRRIKLLLGYFPSTGSLQEGLVCYDKKTPTDLHDSGHLHYFTFRSLSRICIERVGFRKVEKYGYGRHFMCRIWPEMFSQVLLIVYK